MLGDTCFVIFYSFPPIAKGAVFSKKFNHTILELLTVEKDCICWVSKSMFPVSVALLIKFYFRNLERKPNLRKYRGKGYKDRLQTKSKDELNPLQ